LLALNPFGEAYVLEQCRPVMSTRFNCLREGAVEAVVGGMPWHLNRDLGGGPSSRLKARLFFCPKSAAVPADSEALVKLLAKHVECKLPSYPIFILDDNECMVVDVRETLARLGFDPFGEGLIPDSNQRPISDEANPS